MPAIKILLFLLLFASPAIAQWNDGYLPEVGEPGVIDTIYGWKHRQDLGTGMINVGPKPGESYGRVWFTGLDGEPGVSDKAHYFELQSGPNLAFKQIRQNSTKLSIRLKPNNYFGAIARRDSRDRLIFGRANIPTIFWEDSNGDYDAVNTTELLTEASPTNEYFDYYGTLLYNTYLTSDTVEDIVSVVIRSYQNDKPDSVFALLYKGGAVLGARKEAMPSETLYLGEHDGANPWHPYYTQGDWRGTVRKDLITGDIRSKAYFHFRNEKPFSLANFARSLFYDTLMVLPDTGGLDVHETFPRLSNALTMRACPRIASDSSADLCITTYKTGEGRTIRLFRGHDRFGMNRLTFDSAVLKINEPGSPFEGFGFSNNMRDVGDMTGTGNRVLYVGISASIRAYHLFYVMGNAMDDTADMAYFVEPYGRAWVDTITANGDNLQDVILGIPGYYTKQDLDQGKTGVGTIHLLYGSNKIPVKGRSSVASSTTTMSLNVYPNPCYGPLTIQLADLHSPSIDLAIHDILGRIVYRRSFDALASLQAMTLDLSVLEAGVYFLQITSGDHSVRTSLRILPR